MDRLIKDIAYRYDANGNRIQKISGDQTVNYSYEKNKIVKEEIIANGSTTTIDYQTDDQGNLLALAVNGVNYYCQFNYCGDVIALTDASGTIVAKYDYGTWGQSSILSDSTPNKVASLNPYRYVGKYGVRYDSDSGLYLMTWRDYDPNIARFTVSDTYPGEENFPFSQNKYLYALGDPINNIDPSGHKFEGLINFGKGAWEFLKPDEITVAWFQAGGMTYPILAPVTGAAGYLYSKSAKALKWLGKELLQPKPVGIIDDAFRFGSKGAGKTTREALLESASNQKLKNAIDQIYRPGATTGDGGLADAIRHQLSTGELVGGKDHLIKGAERVKNLENIIKKEALSSSDLNLAQKLLNDLKSALGGK